MSFDGCYSILLSNGFSSHDFRRCGPHKSDGLTVKAPVLPCELVFLPPSVIAITALDSRSSPLLSLYNI